MQIKSTCFKSRVQSSPSGECCYSKVESHGSPLPLSEAESGLSQFTSLPPTDRVSRRTVSHTDCFSVLKNSTKSTCLWRFALPTRAAFLSTNNKRLMSEDFSSPETIASKQTTDWQIKLKLRWKEKMTLWNDNCSCYPDLEEMGKMWGSLSLALLAPEEDISHSHHTGAQQHF